MTKESSFPWDTFKAETLRTIGRELGLDGSRSRDELVEFLQDVECRGVQRALKTVEVQDKDKDVERLEEERGIGAAHRKRAREYETGIQGIAGPSGTRRKKAAQNASPPPAKRGARGLQVEVVPRLTDLRRHDASNSQSQVPREVPKRASKGKGRQKEPEETPRETEDTSRDDLFRREYERAYGRDKSSSRTASESRAEALKPLAVEDLRLIVRLSPRQEFNPSDDDSEEDSWSKTLNIYIKTTNGRTIGEMTVLLIYRDKAIKEWGSFFASLHECGLEDFAEQVFISDEQPEFVDDYIQEEIELLTECWLMDEFANESPLVFVENILVHDPWRRKGVGTWAYRHLLALPQCAGANYLFARPAYGKAKLPEEKKSVSFHRKVGFRRIGVSAFCAWAKDPHHPSRAVPSSKDTSYEEPEELDWDYL